MSDFDLANDGRSEFQVWWIPQIPGKPFVVSAQSYADGKRIEDILANYDIFQFESRIKGDYANAGGTQWRHPVLTSGEFVDLEYDEAEEYGWEV